ncbi:MAG: ABC-2 family transporter protein [Finegoldia sp.]|nr:ABC-2 family transporter protein [Finegoldia sp.]
MKYLKLYWKFITNCIRRETLYRFHFVVNMFTVVFGYLANVLFYHFIYSYGIDNISGWNVYEVYVLLATIWIVDSIFGGLFFFNLIQIPTQVKKYQLDGLLVKPINHVFILTMRQFNFGIFSGVFFGIGFLIYAVVKGGVEIRNIDVFNYIVLVCCSVVLLFSILFIMVAFSLRFVRIQGLIQMFWTLMEPGKRLHSIYPLALKNVFTFIVPAIVIYNFPSEILIRNHFFDYLGLGTTFLISIIMASIFLAISICYFKKSLKYYYN